MREEWIVFLVMIGIAVIGALITKNNRKWMPAVLLAGAVAGSLVSGMGLRFREIVEGPFAFLDVALNILCAAVFARLYLDCGGMERLLNAIGRVRSKTARTYLLLLVTALPGMLTGSAAACVIISGPLVKKYMKSRGIKEGKIAQFIAVGAFLGMILPPNCIPAMIAANGAGSVLPTPYVGFFLPLLVLSLPGFIAYGLLAAKTVFKDEAVPAPAERQKHGLLRQLPLIVVALLLLCEGLLGSFIYLGGQPVAFLLGAVLCLLLPEKRLSLKEAYGAVQKGLSDLLPSVALMFALGSFIEVSSMTGIRGLYSLYILPWTSAPYYSTPVLLVSMLVMLPLGLLFGAGLPGFAAAYAIFPIGWLANVVPVAGCAAALSVALLLPLRGGIQSTVKEELALPVRYGEVMKGAWLPCVITLIVGALMVVFGSSLTMLIL